MLGENANHTCKKKHCMDSKDGNYVTLKRSRHNLVERVSETRSKNLDLRSVCLRLREFILTIIIITKLILGSLLLIINLLSNLFYSFMVLCYLLIYW